MINNRVLIDAAKTFISQGMRWSSMPGGSSFWGDRQGELRNMAYSLPPLCPGKQMAADRYARHAMIGIRDSVRSLYQPSGEPDIENISRLDIHSHDLLICANAMVAAFDWKTSDGGFEYWAELHSRISGYALEKMKTLSPLEFQESRASALTNLRGYIPSE